MHHQLIFIYGQETNILRDSGGDQKGNKNELVRKFMSTSTDNQSFYFTLLPCSNDIFLIDCCCLGITVGDR